MKSGQVLYRPACFVLGQGISDYTQCWARSTFDAAQGVQLGMHPALAVSGREVAWELIATRSVKGAKGAKWCKMVQRSARECLLRIHVRRNPGEPCWLVGLLDW